MILQLEEQKIGELKLKLIINIITYFFLTINLNNIVHAKNFKPLKENNNLLWQAYESKKYDIACKGWKEKAKQKSKVDEFNYGYCLEVGLNSQPRPSEASIWYGRAAEAGLPQAQHNLGLLRAEGKGVRKDIILAYFWLKISSEYLRSSKRALNELHSKEKFNKVQIRKINQLLRAYYYKNKKFNN